MNRLDRIAAFAGLPGWTVGLAVALVLIWAGRALLDRVLPGGAGGAEVGWAVFVVLTGLAVERADRFASMRFWGWVGGGAVLGLLTGAVCRGLATGG